MRDQHRLMILRPPARTVVTKAIPTLPPWFRNRLVRLEALLFLFFGKKEYASWLTGTNSGAMPSPWMRAQ